VYMNCHCVGSKHSLENFQHGMAIIYVILYVPTIPPTRRRPLFFRVVAEFDSWLYGACGAAAKDEPGSQEHGKEISRIKFL
jgi:hypothetical protein